jgi:hypothetical protein
MKTLFWKAYYYLTLGEEYTRRIATASSVYGMITTGSRGDFSQKYDVNGNEIRGWHKTSPSFVRSNAHPLVTYYNKK